MAEPRWRLLWIAPMRVVAVGHSAALIVQAGLAGALLDAVDGALQSHGEMVGAVLSLAMLQPLVALLAWRPGRWPFWPVLASLAIVAAGFAQVAAGQSSSLSVHVPLGVSIVAAQVALTVWTLRRHRAPAPSAARSAGRRPRALV